jgi:hypothetical protein
MFYLSWKRRDDEEWMLNEDLETTESERAEPTVIPGESRPMARKLGPGGHSLSETVSG